MGEFYANKMTDDIMFRGSIDQDDNFTQQEYIFAYYSELLRDKIKRRTLSSFYVKVQGKMGGSFLSRKFYKCCGKKNFDRLAKAHHLNERETKKFAADYEELRQAYKKMNKKISQNKGLSLVVLPNFQALRDNEIRSNLAIEHILGGTKAG